MVEELNEGEECKTSYPTLNDFTLKKVLGRGTFGKVFLIERKSNPGEIYAMKSIDKVEIID